MRVYIGVGQNARVLASWIMGVVYLGATVSLATRIIFQDGVRQRKQEGGTHVALTTRQCAL